MNRTEAGFHLLMLLSLADGSIQKSESSVILEFLEAHYHEPIDLIKEQAFLRACPEEDRFNHFVETAQQFYKISTTEERNSFLSFAMELVMSDETMENQENKFINTLYDCWDLE